MNTCIQTILFLFAFTHSCLFFCAAPDTNYQDKDGLTPLMHELKKQNIQAVQHILSASSCNLEVKDKEGKNALYHAVLTQNPVLIQLVSEKLQEKLLFPKLDPDELDYFPED